MAFERPQWMQVTAAEGGYSAQRDRLLTSSLFTEGVIGALDLKVTQKASGANYSVDVAAGACAIQGDAVTLQGIYLSRSTAVENLVPTPVPAPGTPRIDLVVAELRDHTHDASTFKDWRVRIVAGTPAGSPVVPATPASCIPLASFPVTSATTSIATADITDLRTFARPATQRFGALYGTTTVTTANLNGGSGSPIMQQVVPAQGFPYRLDIDAAFGYNVPTGSSESYIRGEVYDGSTLLRTSSVMELAGAVVISATLTIAPVSLLVPGGGAKTIKVAAGEIGTPAVTVLDGLTPFVSFLRCIVVPTG